MSETVFTICGETLQAWELTAAGGKKSVSLLASTQIGEDAFSPEGSPLIERFLKDLNGGEEEKPEPKSKITDLVSQLKIAKLESLLDKIEGGVKKRHSARLLISGIDLFLRKVELPFDDVKKARLAAPSVLSSTLPFEGGVLLDLIPLKAEAGQGRFLAVCVKQEEVARLENVFSNTDFTLEQVVPGFLLLLTAVEKNDGGKDAGIYIDGRVGAKANRDWRESGSVRIIPLALAEEEMVEGEKTLSTVIDISGKDGGSDQPAEGLTRGISTEMLSEYLNHPVLSGFNLISAKITEFRDASAKKTKKIMIIASAILLVLSLIFSIEGLKHFNRKKSDSIRKVMGQKFTEIMKGSAMVDPVAQIKEKISSMEEELALFPREENPLYSLLISISSTLKSSDGITIREINFIRGKLTVTGEAPNQDSVTTFKNRLSDGRGDNVEISETGPSATEGRVKFKLSIT